MATSGGTPLDVYCFDTGPFIELGKLPRSTFKTLWERVEDLIRGGRLITPREVLKELDEGIDDLPKWVRSQSGLVRPNTPELVQSTMDVLKIFPSLSYPNKPGGGAADPFVLALARIENDLGQARLVDKYRCVLVTQERAKPGKMNIPAACMHFGLHFMNMNQLYVAEGWSF